MRARLTEVGVGLALALAIAIGLVAIVTEPVECGHPIFGCANHD